MKVLYIAWHDPMNIDVGNAMDYFHYHSICNKGLDVKYIGPFDFPPAKIESLIARIYQRTGKRYLKFKMSTSWNASKATNQAVQEWKPDIVFTSYIASLVFYKGPVPVVYTVDTSFYGLEKYWPLYGRPALMVSMWQEKKAYRWVKKILTNSEWHRKILMDVYKVPFDHTEVFPLPSTLPPQHVPVQVDMETKKLHAPLRLLLVGRNYRRKGIDIAIETVQKLNSAGIFTLLTVCGAQGQEDQFVKFVGPYKKNDPYQLKQYLDLYQKANILIHPALFEPAGIVAAEAAAFGTPTVTNDVGGLATTVADGESGIVLPAGSPSDAYVQAITHLIQNPDGYYELCRRTRQRYEHELNWEAAGKWFTEIFQQVVKGG